MGRLTPRAGAAAARGVNRPRLDAVVLLRPLVTLWHWAYPWYQGAKLPWCHGTMVPWHHGNMVPWGGNGTNFSPDVARPILARESRFWGIRWGDRHHFSRSICSDWSKGARMGRRSKYFRGSMGGGRQAGGRIMAALGISWRLFGGICWLTQVSEGRQRRNRFQGDLSRNPRHVKEIK